MFSKLSRLRLTVTPFRMTCFWFSWSTVIGTLVMLCLLLAALNHPFSYVYSSLHSEEFLTKAAIDLNNERTDSARSYFSQLQRKTVQELQVMSQPEKASFEFTIVIITVARKKQENSNRSVGYIMQSAASVHGLVTKHASFRDSFLFVCNVDPSPRDHADAVVLKDYLPYVERYGTSVIPGVFNLSIPGTEKLYRETKHVNTFDRERHDYTFCLHVAQRFRSQYFLILQDDAVLHADFSDVLDYNLNKLTKVQQCLQDKNNSSPSSVLASYVTCLLNRPPYSSLTLPQRKSPISPSPDASFGYIKFYFPERWQGFAIEPLRILDLASVAAVGGGLGLFIHAVWCFINKLTFKPTRRVFLVAIVLTLIMAELMGRQNINEIRRISKYFYRLQPSPSCCIPAMLYPAPVMPFLVTWLAESPEKNKVDLRIADFFRHYDIPTYYIEPNIVKHVGMVTSLQKRVEKPVEEFVLFR